MISPTVIQWEKWTITEEKYKFFIVRLDELFSEDAYESWQVRSTNIKFLLNELIQSSNIVQNIPSHKGNLDDIIDEINKTKIDDEILKKKFSNVIPIISKITTLNKSTDKEKYLKIEQYSLFALKHLESYFQEIIDEIKNILFSEVEYYKIKLNGLLQLFATEVNSLGYSHKYINEVSHVLKTTGSFEKRFEHFIEKITCEKRLFKCYYLIRSNFNIDNFTTEKFRTINKEEFEDSYECRNFLEQDENSIIVEYDIYCFDKITASIEAEKAIKDLLSIKFLFQPSLTDTVIYPICLVKDKNYEIVKQIEKLPVYIQKSNNIINDYQNLLSIFDNIDNKEKGYISSSIQYFKLSIMSTNKETRFVNLWIALESLFQEQEGNILKRLSNFVPEISASNYIYEILRSISKDINLIWKRNDTENILTSLLRSESKYLHPSDINEILLLKDSHENYLQLTNLIQENPLLSFRIYNIKNSLYKSSSDMEKGISKHYLNIKWQLRRIYRLRNKIMHRGSIDVPIDQYYHHLYTYYINTIYCIIKILNKNNTWSISMALNYEKLNYENFMLALKDKEKLSIETIYRSNINFTSGNIAWEDSV